MEAPRSDVDAAAVRQKKNQKRRIINVVAVAVVIVLIGAFVLIRRSNNQNPLSGMVTAQVGRATIVQKISATGSVTAQTGAQVNIGSQISGRIKSLYADVGSHVKAGQVIAVLDLPDVKAQLDQSVAALNSAELAADQQESGVGLQQTTTRSDISKARASLDSAQATYNQDAKTAHLQVQTARAAVNQATASYQNAVTFLNREKQLLAKGYIAAQDVDNAQTQANVAAAQLDSARQNLLLTQARTVTALQTDRASMANAQAVLAAARAGTAQNIIKLQQVAAARSAVHQAQANVQYWQDQYKKTIIRTPISGTVISLSAQQGETVAAGFAAPTLVTVTDLNRLQVDAYVDETDIGNVHIGQPAIVTVDAYPNMVFHGHVDKIAAGGTLQQNVVTYDTTVALDNPRALLKPSMTATVNIVVREHRNVVAVPIEAVKYIGQAQVVYVVQGDKIASHTVATGISDDTNTEILSGVRSGDTIVLAGYPPSGTSRPGLFGPSGGGRGGGSSSSPSPGR